MRRLIFAFLTGLLPGLLPAQQSLFPANSIPAIVSDSDTAAVELGVKVTPAKSGEIRAVRFYKSTANTGTHVASVWSSTGQLLGRATFTNETASGWQRVQLSPAVAVKAGTTYVVSYHAPRGRYSINRSFFATAATVSGDLTAPRSTSASGNGVYNYSSSPAFPTQSWNASNYWVDLEFVADTATQTTPTAPTTSANTPTTTTTVTASGVSIWPATTVPATAAQNDTAAVEVGVKFRSSQSGKILGVKFFKGAGNGGTHTGRLWSATGTLLASGTFVNETATGWQTLTFAAPVAISANTVYVASYHAPQGRYAINTQFFASAGVTNGALTALRNGDQGANGVYRYGGGGVFPTASFQSSNYWVDVVFEADVVTVQPVAPTITRQPAGVSVTEGEAASFSVTATGDGTLSYQWQRNGSNISGATAATYSISKTVLGDDGANLRVVVSNAAGSTTSSVATLRVAQAKPVITTQPAGVTVTAGGSATFGVVASGSNLSYQWSKNGTTIAGATAASYTASGLTLADANAVYRVVVTNAAGSATSNEAKVTVNAAGVSLSLTPATATVEPGAQVTLTAQLSTSATGTSFSGDVEFVDGATVVGKVAVSSTGEAKVTISAPTSGSRTIQAKYAGNAFFAATTSGNATVTATTRSELPTENELASIWPETSIPTGSPANDGQRVVLGLKFRPKSNGLIRGVRYYKPGGVTGTRVGKLWTRTGTLLATTQFVNETAKGWQRANFPTAIAVQANTTYIVSYDVPDGAYFAAPEALKNAGVSTTHLSALRDGEDGANGVFVYGSATTVPTSTYQSSHYWVDVLFDAGTTQSTGAPVISTGPANTKTSAGASVSFQVSASGNATLRYQWRRNGANINGATGAQLTLASPTLADHGALYSVLVYNDAGYVVSNPARLEVTGEGSTTTLSLSSAQVSPGVTIVARVRVTRGTGGAAPAGGSVQLLSDGNVLTSGSIDQNGEASLSWVTSTAGVFELVARYAGTSAIQSSTSAALTASVFVALPEGGRPPSVEEASRFLAQATFGPTLKDINRLMAVGYDQWFEDQYTATSRSYYDTDGNVGPNLDNHNSHVIQFYTQAALHPDQLRQRMAWSLSQIFVVSGLNGSIQLSPYGYLMTYADMLKRNAFGTYRQLLEDVTRSWMMSLMLTYLGNAENVEAGILPDQNYAREILQLFSIGLYELELDGSLKLRDGKPIETYSLADIIGLSKVFTGFYETRLANGDIDPQVRFLYPGNRSKTEKKFLGVTLPASSLPDAEQELKVALDTIAKHPNVGPFLSKQLIQRMVTSNPSPDYIRRVATVFNNNGSGVRGDLKAVLRAVLMDPEARNRDNVLLSTWGKAREPILGAMHLNRVLEAKASDGYVYDATRNCYYVWDVMGDVAMRPYHAPTVFNYYRPGFAPPGSELDAANLVAPEMQILDTVNTYEWSRFILDAMRRKGTGGHGGGPCQAANPFNLTPWTTLAATPTTLIDRINLLLFAGTLDEQSRTAMVTAIENVTASSTQARLEQRVQLAFMLAFTHPQYIVQK